MGDPFMEKMPFPPASVHGAGRIIAVCTARGCFWVRTMPADGKAWEGQLLRPIPRDRQEAAGVVCPLHRPHIEARCACRRRRVDGRWEARPLDPAIPLDTDLPCEACPTCAATR